MPVLRYFETHCHLNHADFAADYGEVLGRARTAGLSELLIVGYDLPSSRRAVELARPEAGIYAAVGVHPHAAETWGSAAEAELRTLADAPGTVAIGEIGLDFYRDLSPREAQYTAFRAQLELATELRLPFIVHTRESVTPSLDVLEPYCRAGVRGIMHCWSGTLEESRRARELGLLLGVGGVLTYKSAGALQEVVADSSLDDLVLETDCPYLTPVPYRGGRNEPSYLPLVAQRLAQIKGVSVEQVAGATRANALGRLGLA
jgi:TatD DNase family protein